MGLFGTKYPDAEKLEQQELENKRLYQEVLATANSQELREYLELKDELNSPEFKSDKASVVNLKWKNTKEYNKLSTFNKLAKNKSLKEFLKLEKSSELKDYETFKQTEAYAEINNKKARKASPELQKFYKFENSKSYKAYQSINGSQTLKQYHDLKEEIESEKFLNYKAYCENKHRWNTTEGAKKEQRYAELDKDENIQNYLKYHNSDIFNLFKNYEITFSEDFAPEKLDMQKWDTKFHLGAEFGKGNYSKNDHLQAYTNGRNIAISRDYATIETLKEKATGRVWDPKLGFIEKEMDFTSGVISTGKSFKQEEGIYKVKFKYESHSPLAHSIQLISKKGDIQIKLFQVSPKGKIMLGVSYYDGRKYVIRTTSVKGIKPESHFYIASLEWINGILIWKMNEKEVFRTEITLPGEELFLEIASMIYKTKKQPSPGKLILDWVKAYKKTA